MTIEPLEGRRLLSADAAPEIVPAGSTSRPAVIAKEFIFETNPPQIRFTFSENVQPSLTAQDLEVTNLLTGLTFSPSSVTYDTTNNTATFLFSGPLANASYVALLTAPSVNDTSGNIMASEQSLGFFVLNGDVNRDRAVNSQDFVIIARNFGQTGKTYGEGDLDDSGRVDSQDFVLMAANFGRQVPAVAIVYEGAGFERPRFVAGQSLEGQDTELGPWFNAGGTGTAVVQTGTVNRGEQSVQVTRPPSPTGDSRWAVPTPLSAAPGEGVVNIDVAMNVSQSTGFTFGPVFGIEAYDATGSSPKLIGSLTVDAATGDVLYQQAGTGFLTETGVVVARGSYNTYRLSVNFASKTYSIFVNGTPVRTEGFVDNTATAFSDAPISTLAATADTVATATGTAFFDNYRISHVPDSPGAPPAGAPRAAGLTSGQARPKYVPSSPRGGSQPAVATVGTAKASGGATARTAAAPAPQGRLVAPPRPVRQAGPWSLRPIAEPDEQDRLLP